MSDAEVVPVGESALLVRFGTVDLAAAVACAQALHACLAEAPPAGVEEMVLGAGSLLLRLGDGGDALSAARTRVAEALTGLEPVDLAARGRLLEIGVEFGGEAGPDLEEVARACGLGGSAVVARLCAAPLTVAFIGFSPGFPYLIGLPPELEVPRLPSPRPRVPAGSVAIAGPFAGIYPSATPGGWRLLGRTDRRLFDAAADPPARLAPGDRVRLVAR